MTKEDLWHLQVKMYFQLLLISCDLAKIRSSNLLQCVDNYLLCLNVVRERTHVKNGW